MNTIAITHLKYEEREIDFYGSTKVTEVTNFIADGEWERE